MLFFVLGVDRPDVAGSLDELSEAHWAYLDGFVGALVARGPTLSADGEVHSGSVHVVDVADIAAAQRFATEELFASAGLYASVTVTRFHDGVGGTMWDRPPATPAGPSALVLVTWAGEAASGDLDARWRALTGPADVASLVFGGLLLGEDGCEVQGMVLATDLPVDEAGDVAARLAVPAGATVSVQRWQRGGRPDSVGLG